MSIGKKLLWTLGILLGVFAAYIVASWGVIDRIHSHDTRIIVSSVWGMVLGWSAGPALLLVWWD